MNTIRELSEHLWLPCTQQFDVSAWIACDADGDGTVDRVRLSIETTPPTLVFECSTQAASDGSGVNVREATAQELEAVLTGLLAMTSDRFAGGTWEPLQIKALFTTNEWAQAKAVASETFEALTLTFHPIESATVLAHLRGLIGPVLTEARFTEITGRAV